MPDVLLELDAFRDAARDGRAEGLAVRRFTTVEPKFAVGDDSRTIPWTFSDASVDSELDRVDAAGFDLVRYRSNPVVLWAHDGSAPPIAQASNVRVDGSRLAGDVTFADAETYDFADTIFRLVKGRFLRAGSVGFLPIEWVWSKDPARPGGIDFKRQELLEFSICPIPANPNALLQARAAGIDTRPLIGWAEKLLDGGERILVPRAELETLRRAAAEPQTHRKHEDAMSNTKTAQRGVAGAVAKDLNDVSWLSSLLQSLAALEGWVRWEAQVEGDNSPIPARLAAVVQALGGILVDMTAEEVAELLAAVAEGEAAYEGAVMMAAHSPAQKALVALARMARRPAPAAQKAGRVLSATNESDIRQARELLDGVLCQVAGDPEPDEGAEKAAARLRKAKALQRRVSLAA